MKDKLNFTEAIAVYKIISQFLPKTIGEDVSLIDYLVNIVEGLKWFSAKKFVELLEILSGLSEKEISTKTTSYHVSLLVKKFQEYQILDFCRYMRSLGL